LNPPPIIRLVRTHDAPALIRLRAHAGWDADKVPQWIAESLAGQRPTWVVEVEGEPVGMVSLEWDDADPEVANGRDVAAVTSLSILPHAEGKGLGKALTVFAELRARERGIEVLTLNTGPTNTPAIHLYESLGYRQWKETDRPWGRAVFLRKRL